MSERERQVLAGLLAGKTNKGLPQYRDADASVLFILSGAEDLVPVYRQAVGAAVGRLHRSSRSRVRLFGRSLRREEGGVPR